MVTTGKLPNTGKKNPGEDLQAILNILRKAKTPVSKTEFDIDSQLDKFSDDEEPESSGNDVTYLATTVSKKKQKHKKGEDVLLSILKL